jgi:hypothetical protein
MSRATTHGFNAGVAMYDDLSDRAALPRKKLNRKVTRQGKDTVKVKAFVTFVPAGVAGMPNTEPVKTKLIKKRKRTKR